jgi:pimeloyl-ACP methyl ester carboxylesterase
MAAQAQFAGLSRLYNIQCLSLPAEDRTGLEELLDIIAAHIDAQCGSAAAEAGGAAGAAGSADAAAPAAAQPRRVHLLGESMGGMMALAGACGAPARAPQRCEPRIFRAAARALKRADVSLR